jgi:phosphoglycerol transferase MdoB-like AlkP superfamily enzyme
VSKELLMTKVKEIHNSNWFAFLIRFLFVVSLIIGERMFLGPVTHSQGKADLLTSIAMMLLVLLAIERFTKNKPRKALLIITGAFLIFFQLLAGLYYRFFHSTVPFDIFHQWHDFFVVKGYGSSLLSGTELMVAIIIPVALLTGFLFKPVKIRPFVFMILIALLTFGWTHRLNRPVNRPAHKMSSLPDYIHRNLYYEAKVGLGKNRYLQIVSDVEAAIPRNLDGYNIVKGKGILVEPESSAVISGQIKYNVIFIMMESMRSYECGFLGAATSFTPRLDRLSRDALVYTNFYANGTQTVRAELASLCSVYTNPIGVPDYLVNPALNLISLPEILSDSNYDTLWFSGYTADFHNKRMFLTQHGVKKIYDRDVFPDAAQPEIGWGMNDCEMFDNVWNVLKDTKGPFFAQITTLSNHVAEKAEYPTAAGTPAALGADLYAKYTQGIYYTDYAVSKFIEKVLNSKLAENTIIIAMGDHGLWNFPEGVTDSMQKLEVMFRVPLCIWGPESIITSGQDTTLGSQVDLSPTLMDLLNVKHTNTFLGQSLVKQDIPSSERYVVTLLGSIANIRVGDIFSISQSRLDEETRHILNYVKVQEMKPYHKENYNFVAVKGDLLRGRYTTAVVNDDSKKNQYSQRVDDIVFLTSYGVYKDAYKGIE